MSGLFSNGKFGVYLNLGAAGIRLNFSGRHFAVLARQHIFLSETFNGQIAGIIDYIEDDSVSRLISTPCKPNAVYIARDDLGEGHQKIALRMFDKFTFELEIQGAKVTVRYPSAAPLRLMLDDVLQAALQPILERIGGFILHGSCMVREGTAIVFMGKSGSGKSTTAFNLIRFGFRGYADDAVLITPLDNVLWAWPFAREFSIRPLSFRLFHEQGIQISGYKKEGGKYYFSQGSGTCRGAILKHICFVEVSGETETFISYLTPEQALQRLLQEKRHFSFMGRQSAKTYSRTLAEKVPAPFKACVGMNLDSQGQVIEEAISGSVSPSSQKNRARSPQIGRQQKMALIHRAWSSPGQEPLEELIPLLSDFDLKVFALALAFFQTYPYAQIEPLKSTFTEGAIPQKFEASWLRAIDWVQGCRKLVCQSGVEVFGQFTLPWIKSAPFIYPFLKALTSHDLKKSEQVEKAWNRYRKSAKEGNNNCAGLEIHLADFQNVSLWGTMFHDWWGSLISPENESLHVYCWITQTEQLNRREMRPLLKTIGKILVTVVPVGIDKNDIFTTPVEFVRLALECGLKPKISRFTPLCRISDEDARFLFNTDTFEKTREERQVKRLLFMKPGSEELSTFDSIRGIQWPDYNALWSEKPYSACASCGLYSLGFCLGGFFCR